MSQLNSGLVVAIREYLSKDLNVVHELMDMLSLGREAIYRRLRGEVPFTFEEAAKISLQLGFSLDNIVDDSNLCKNKWAVLDIDSLYSSANFIDQYGEKVKMLIDVFDEVKDLKTARLRCANATLPYIFILPYEKLSLFWIYKWAYLTHGISPDFCFSKVIKPDHVVRLERQLITRVRQIPRAFSVLDKKVFASMAKDIAYFYQRRLISDDELLQLKSELLELTSFMEALATTGSYKDGGDVHLYLSDVDIDASYVHVEYDGYERCIQWAHFINMLSYRSPKICQTQKEWIELLKRYSQLITQSGEVARFDFFNEQRILVEELLSSKVATFIG